MLLTLGRPTGGASVGTQATATLTIGDDDTSLVTIDDRSVAEGNGGAANATFTVTLSTPNSRTVTVAAQTATGTATAGGDYTPVGPTTVTFAPGETSRPFAVPVLGDTADEPNETFFVNLTNAANATIDDAQGLGTILDDDGPPALSIPDQREVEGNGGTTIAVFTVTLLPASAQAVTVVAQTANASGADAATAGADYQPTSPTTLTFGPGETSTTFAVPVVGEVVPEADETFLVNLSGPTNALIQDGQAVGTIEDDDVRLLSVDDVQVAEGGNGGAGAAFTVSLSAASTQTVTVVVRTANGTATAGTDYTAVGPVTVTFVPGLTLQTVIVPILAAPAVGPPVFGATDDGTDTPRKETGEQRQQRERTNRGGKDDVYVEGNVVEVHPEAEPPYVMIGNRDGLVKVVLYKDAAQSASGIKVSDYLEADGEKVHEQLFEATDVSVK